ncbi:unnamed protein product [Sphagnum compactum]
MVKFVVFLSFCCWKECHRRGALEFSILQGFGVLCSSGSSILPAVLVGCLSCSLRLCVGEVQVKKKTSRQKVREKASKKQEGKKARNKEDEDSIMAADTGSEWDGKDLISTERASLKRKMAKQLRFLSKLQETQRVLSATKKIAKKRRRSQTAAGKTLNDLSSLAEFLPSIYIPTAAAEAKPTTKILRSKARQKIVVQETKQLAAVLAHPQFKSNPFAAIQQHLSNTLPSPPPPLQPNTKQMSNQKPGAKNKTRKKNAQSMDVA